MQFLEASFSGFRNLKEKPFVFDRVNIICGDNANGKTNLVEGLYLFTGAKSFRGAKRAELIAFGQEKAVLQSRFFAEGREQTAKLELGEAKTAWLNGVKKKSPLALGEAVHAVVFSPDHLRLVKDGPGERRRFLDQALGQIRPKYRLLLGEYERCLAQRNKLLKDARTFRELEDMLAVWDETLAGRGAAVLYQRKKYVEKITPPFETVLNGISGGRERGCLRLSGGFDEEAETQEEIRRSLLKSLQQSRADDIATGTTSAGPHRSDLQIEIGGKSARAFASQGQSRSAVIALKLAEAAVLEEMCGTKPVILLDDVMSELDAGRQQYVMEKICGYQIFITCCDRAAVHSAAAGKILTIKDGEEV